MPGMVSDPGVLLDHLGDPGQRPQVVAEATGTGAGQQGLLDLGQLRRAYQRGPAGRATAAQRVLAALLPAAMPALTFLRSTPSSRAISAWGT
jgi:hypothetical protein